jgi:hypothetical protein
MSITSVTTITTANFFHLKCKQLPELYQHTGTLRQLPNIRPSIKTMVVTSEGCECRWMKDYLVSLSRDTIYPYSIKILKDFIAYILI